MKCLLCDDEIVALLGVSDQGWVNEDRHYCCRMHRQLGDPKMIIIKRQKERIAELEELEDTFKAHLSDGDQAMGENGRLLGRITQLELGYDELKEVCDEQLERIAELEKERVESLDTQKYRDWRQAYKMAEERIEELVDKKKEKGGQNSEK